jgi:hypothetical protein
MMGDWGEEGRLGGNLSPPLEDLPPQIVGAPAITITNPGRTHEVEETPSTRGEVAPAGGLPTRPWGLCLCHHRSPVRGGGRPDISPPYASDRPALGRRCQPTSAIVNVINGGTGGKGLGRTVAGMFNRAGASGGDGGER